MSRKSSENNMSSDKDNEAVSQISPIKPSEVSSSRRRFSRLGLTAPVLMTIASKPVFGAPCLSNILSGNLSDPNRGTCVLGARPSDWGNPTGTVMTATTQNAWTQAGFLYAQSSSGQSGNVTYSGGTTAGTLPFSTLLPGVDANTTLREILVANPESMHSLIIAAYLNASLSAKLGSFAYVLTPQQVIDLVANPTSLPSAAGSLENFFRSTW